MKIWKVLRPAILGSFLLTVSLLSAAAAPHSQEDPTPMPEHEDMPATGDATPTGRTPMDEGGLTLPTPENRETVFDLMPTSRTEDGGFVIGDPDAPITIVEFADWGCPHCQEYQPTIQRILDEYVIAGLVRFEFRIFPTAGGETTYYAGKVAECADLLHEGGFWDAYQVLFTLAEFGRYDEDTIVEAVSNLIDVDEETLADCADDPVAAAQALAAASGEAEATPDAEASEEAEEPRPQVDIDMALAFEIGISGTPGVRVRYNVDGEAGELEVIEFEGVLYDRGAVSYEVLIQIISAIMM